MFKKTALFPRDGFPIKEKDDIQLVHCDHYFNPDHPKELLLQKKTIMHSGIYRQIKKLLLQTNQS